MERVFGTCLEFAYGVRDSLRFQKVVEFVLISNTIKGLLVKTFLINGVLIGGSAIILRMFSRSAWVMSLSHYELAQTIFSILYHVLYLYPLYLGSFIFNSFYYLDIAGDAMSIEQKLFNNRGGIKPPNADIVTRIYNEVINALVLIFFIIQSFLLSFIPFFGPILHLISQSFGYAFYCFAYKWGTDQVKIYKILAFFEKYFAYFVGFGFTFACITNIFPGLLGSGVYAALFPVFLLLAIKGAPPKELHITSADQFLEHLKTLFKRNKQEKSMVEYDYIDTFKYEEVPLNAKHPIGIFTFPLIGIEFVGSYLNKKIKI